MVKNTCGSSYNATAYHNSAEKSARKPGASLARKSISVMMAVILAVGLMPLPAYAQGAAGYAAGSMATVEQPRGQASIIAQAASKIAAQSAVAARGTAYAIYDQGCLTFVRSVASLSNGDKIGGLPLVSVSGEIYNSGTVYTGFESAKYGSKDETPWRNQAENVAKVVFADDIEPVSCAYWFSGFSNIESVVSPENLDMSEVEDISFLFQGCSSLEALDVTGWNVSKVQNARSTFEGCSGLASLDLSGWSFSANNMLNMFNGCQALDFLDLSGFDTSGTSGMSGMFSDCYQLSAVRLGEGFSFYGKGKAPKCSVGTASASWYKVDDPEMAGYRGGDASDDDDEDSGIPVFAKEYGKKDGMAGVWREARSGSDGALDQVAYHGGSVYAVFDPDSGTLSFVRRTSDEKPTGENATGAISESAAYAKADDVPWHRFGDRVTRVTFEETVQPQSTAYWFAGFTALTSVDASALDTSNTSDMTSMFAGCTSLTKIEGLGYLKTSKATSMGNLFSGCSSLASLDLSSFDTKRATASMGGMFSGCDSLEKVKLGSQFKFGIGDDCLLPPAASDGSYAWKWAAGNDYSEDQKTPKELADAAFADQLAGTWVRGRDLSYVVTFYDGDEAQAIRSHSVASAYALPSADELGMKAPDGYAFKGWATSSSDTDDLTDVLAERTVSYGEAVSLYAVWSRDIRLHVSRVDATPGESPTVEQRLNGGTAAAVLPNSLFADINAYGDWKPYGWAVMPDSLADVVPVSGEGESVTYEGDAGDLYAVYTRDLRFVYDANAGEDEVDDVPGEELADQFYVAGQAAPEKVTFTVNSDYCDRKGYTHEGWSESPDATTGAKGISVEDLGLDDTGDALKITLYAAWKPVEYTVKFEPNGGEGAAFSRTRHYGDGEPLPECKFERIGYEFVGWMEAGNQAKVRQPGDTGNLATSTQTIRLLAKWEPVEYTVTLSYGEGTLTNLSSWGADGWENDSIHKTVARTFTIEDEVKLPILVSRIGYRFGGWIDGDGKARLGIAKGTVRDVSLSAKWRELLGAPNVDNGLVHTGLVYTGAQRVGVEAGTGYVLEAKSDGARKDEATGNVTAASVGTHTATARLTGDAYVWSDGTDADKDVDFSIVPGVVAKVSIASAGAEDDAQVDVYTIDENGELVKFENASEDFDVTFAEDAFGNAVATVKATGEGIAAMPDIAAPYEVTDNPDGRRTETAVVNGSTVSKLFDANSGEDSLEKVTVVEGSVSPGGTVVAREYTGSGMVADERGNVSSGAEKAVVTAVEYGTDAKPAKVTARTYEAAEGATDKLDVTGDTPSGAAKYSEGVSEYKNGKVSKETTSTYEAAAGQTLDLTGDAVAGAATLETKRVAVSASGVETATVSTYEAPEGKTLDIAEGADGALVGKGAAKESTVTTVKTPGNDPETATSAVSTVERAFADDGSVTSEVTRAYASDLPSGMTVVDGEVKDGVTSFEEKAVAYAADGSIASSHEKAYESAGADGAGMTFAADGRVASGAAKLVETQVVNGEAGSTVVTTTYAGDPNLDTSGDEVKGCKAVSRLTVEKDSDGNAVRVEDVTTLYEGGVQTDYSETIFEGDPFVELNDDGTVNMGKSRPTSQLSSTSSKTLEGYQTEGTVAEYDAEGELMGTTKVTTTINEGEDGSHTIKSVARPQPFIEGETPETVTTLVVSPAVEGGDAVTQTVTNQDGEQTIMTLDKETGKLVEVCNADNTVRLTGDALSSLGVDGSWVWLSVGKYDPDRGNAAISAAAKKKYDAYNASRLTAKGDGYESEKTEVYTLKLNLLNAVTGASSSRNAGLSDLKVQFLTSLSFDNRLAHATHVYSIWDTQSWGDSDADKLRTNDLGVVSLTVNSLNEFVIAVEKKAFSVSYEANGGTAVDSEHVAEGSQATKPDDPTRAGYAFDGWYADPALKTAYDFANPVSSDITLYAGWKGDLSKATVKLTTTSKAYNGTAFKPLDSVALSDGTPVDAASYTVTYLDSTKKTTVQTPKAQGTYYVMVTGKGEQCVGSTSVKQFKISRVSIANAKVTLSKTKQTYNGKKFNPTAKTVKVGSLTLKKGTDYTLSYLNSKKKATSGANVKAAGTYYVKLTGKGNYSGTISKTKFTIDKAADPFKVVAKSGTFKASAKSKTVLKASKLYKITGDKAKGKRSFKRVTLSNKKMLSKFTVASNGNVTVAKGVKAGTYTLTVKATIGAKGSYKSTSKNVKLKIKVS